MATITIPDPSLVLLIGAAGSGKSTFGRKHFAPEEILSSDALREAISGDAADQRATRPAFARLHRLLAGRLRAGRLTVVDATNVQAHGRRALLRHARGARVPVTAIVLDLPPAVVHARNATRVGRVVDPAIVDRHLGAVRALVDSRRLPGEGVDEVVVLRTPAEIDDVVVERRRLPA